MKEWNVPNNFLSYFCFSYYQKIPEELPELELKATFGLAAPIPFEMPEVHAIFTEEAYKDFTVQETAPPKIVSDFCYVTLHFRVGRDKSCYSTFVKCQFPC